MKKFTVTEYCVPEWALSVLLNSDTSGLEVEEEAVITAFFEREAFLVVNGHWSYDSGESYFSWTNDIDSLGGNCIDIQWVQWVG